MGEEDTSSTCGDRKQQLSGCTVEICLVLSGSLDTFLMRRFVSCPIPDRKETKVFTSPHQVHLQEHSLRCNLTFVTPDGRWNLSTLPQPQAPEHPSLTTVPAMSSHTSEFVVGSTMVAVLGAAAYAVYLVQRKREEEQAVYRVEE